MVQLGAAGLEVHLHAAVGFPHEPPHGDPIPRIKRLGESERSSIFADHVVSAAIFRNGEGLLRSIEVG